MPVGINFTFDILCVLLKHRHQHFYSKNITSMWKRIQMIYLQSKMCNYKLIEIKILKIIYLVLLSHTGDILPYNVLGK